MKNVRVLAVVVCMMAAANFASADTFGTGSNQFTIDFVPISGSTNPTSGYGIVNNDYRIGTYEITNDQWNKFRAAYGAVKGNPSVAYNNDPSWTGTDVPTNKTSWYEAAQFVNYLNTSTGHQAAYKFTGPQGSTSYTFALWASTNAGYNADNRYRNSNAFYFLPSEDEWVKAAYWNGTSLQTYATKADEDLTQGNGTNGTGWNYYNNEYATIPYGPWAVGSGSQELNGTYDMMGNVREWTESPGDIGYYADGRGVRGGSYNSNVDGLALSYRESVGYSSESLTLGFRVASVPEPCSLVLLFLGGLVLRRKK